MSRSDYGEDGQTNFSFQEANATTFGGFNEALDVLVSGVVKKGCQRDVLYLLCLHKLRDVVCGTVGDKRRHEDKTPL